MPDSFHCSLVTPERSVYEGELTYANLPAHDGQLGVMTNRAPMLLKLGVGRLKLIEADGGQTQFVLDGGFAQMRENELTLLSERAFGSDDVTAEQARAELAEAKAMPMADLDQVEARNHAVAVAGEKVAMVGG